MVQFKESFVPAGSGLTERQLHLATGLRNACLTPVISSNYAGIFSTNIGLIGTADSSRHGAWPAGLRLTASVWNPVLPVPMTPTMLFYVIPSTGAPGGAFPETVEVKVKVQGTDQFGCYQEEITPWVSKTMTTTSCWFGIHLSKVFSTVDQVYVMTNNITNLGNLSTCGMGWGTNIDPTMAGAATINVSTFDTYWELFEGGLVTSNLDMCGTAANWGVGTPFRVSPYGPSTPYPTPEILGATATILREKNTPTALNTTARLPVRGQLSVAGVAPTTGLCVGRSVAGWEGTPHKVGFFSNNAWTTKVAGINLGGSSTRASGVPTTDAQVGEDELMITVAMRTLIGTMRDSNPTRTYPLG
jgi:hypothetical protein